MRRAARYADKNDFARILPPGGKPPGPQLPPRPKRRWAALSVLGAVITIVGGTIAVVGESAQIAEFACQHMVDCPQILVKLGAGKGAQLPAPGPVEASDLFAAIEIGRSGVKPRVYQTTTRTCDKFAGRIGTTEIPYKDFLEEKRHDYAAYNTDLSDARNVGAVAAEIKAYVDRMYADFAIPAAHILVVGSSSVDDVPHGDELVAAVRAAAGITMEFVSESEEGRLTAQWIMPPTRRYEAVVIDIGSGNTKGGYFIDAAADAEFKSFDTPLGTKSLTKAVDEGRKSTPFPEMLDLVGENAVVTEVRGIGRSHPDLRNRSRVYLAGGVVWAVTTLTRPESVREDWVLISTHDFETVRRRALDGRAFEVNLAQIADAELRAEAETAVKSVQKVFTPEQLLAGIKIATTFSTEMEFRKKEAIFFARSAYSGWISQMVIERKCGGTATTASP